MELKEQNCTVLEKGTPPMDENQIKNYRKMLPTQWQVVDNKVLRKEYVFDEYKRELAFVQALGMVADKENHHPDMHAGYKKVVVEFTTHDVGGLSVNDFIMASKADEL
jgi:4a-hydroxytetrahydrobiopterin dehydratase